MPGGIDAAAANAVLDALLPNSGTTTLGALTYTGPTSLRLMSANGSDTANGTEITAGGGYSAGGSPITHGAAASQGKSNSAALSFTNMPGGQNIVGDETWDASATKKRQNWGVYSATKTPNAGDTLTYPVGARNSTLV